MTLGRHDHDDPPPHPRPHHRPARVRCRARMRCFGDAGDSLSHPQALEDWAADFGEMRDRYDARVFNNGHQTLDVAGGPTGRWDVRRAVELGRARCPKHRAPAITASAPLRWTPCTRCAACPTGASILQGRAGARPRGRSDPPDHQDVTDWEIADEVYTLPRRAAMRPCC